MAKKAVRIRLTEAQAQAVIERVAGGERSKDLAVEYGVSTSTISRIINGQTWGDLTRPQRKPLKRATKLTVDDVLAIKERLQRGDRLVDIARDHEVTGPAISAIRDRRTWAEVTLPERPVPHQTRRRVWEN